ncbi:E1-E2 ATPase-domain-containing protein [Zopfochytrium polystomum]|nr:E1-E2 ATPase-domain-containing protein [Zopfochytrium polystomum]
MRLRTDPERGLSEAMEPATLDGMGRTPAAATDSFLVRKSVFGENKLPQPHTKSVWEFAFEALKDKTLIVLCVAAFVDLAIGIYKSGFAEQREPAAYVDGIAILFAVVVIVLISALNDYRKQSQFRQLSDYSRSLSKFHVIRDGKTREMPTASILVGDICQISAGDILPSDGIVIQSFNLSCDESALTGESMAVSKSPTTDPFVLSGTKVVDGIGKIVIVATGPNSVNGRLLASLEVEVEETPLQAKLGKLADAISLFGLGAALVMVLGLVILYFSIAPAVPRTTVDIVNDLVNLFIIGVTIVVVAVPEGLPLAVVLALAHATLRMLKDNNLVRHLKADKTGTLTQNRMTVLIPDPSANPRPRILVSRHPELRL